MTDVQEEVAYWESQAENPDWAAWAAPGDGVEHFLAPLCDVIERCPESGWVLDLGCGPARLLAPLSRIFPEVNFVGVDISREMISVARQRTPRNVTVMKCDGRTLPVEMELRMAYTTLMFQHIPDTAVRGYLRQIADSLCAGGCLVAQYVDGDDDTPMNRHRSAAQMEMWCEEVGLTTVSHFRHFVYPEWNLITAVKS